METKILVIYVGVVNIRSADIESYVRKVSKRIIPENFEGEIIVIPTNSYDSKIECINPKYITEEDLVDEHNKMMKRLNKELKHQIKQLENEK